VSDTEPAIALLDEEVTFWRGFIAWWAREREGPVPKRAWDALSRAEAKRCAMQDADAKRRFRIG
jgi:hypothetical protein